MVRFALGVRGLSGLERDGTRLSILELGLRGFRV